MTLNPLDRRATTHGVVPRAALEIGLWECDIDAGSWALYRWPTSSLIEQAFCRFAAGVEFEERGMRYRVEFQGPSDEHTHAAVQINVRTGVRRAVRRWPSALQRDVIEARRCAEAWSLWGAWQSADWSWTLLDTSQAGATPHQPSPARVAYSLGCSSAAVFNEPFWPELLRCWPARELWTAAHPLGRKCNFALKRLCAAGVRSDVEGREWASLKEAWRQGGLHAQHRLVAAYRIQNRSLLHSFMSTRDVMRASLQADEFLDGASRETSLNARLLWHGTRTADGLIDICSDGFDRARASTCVYGKGCYFAVSAAYSDKYACTVDVPGVSSQQQARAMLLATVLVGECVQGTSNMYPSPVKPHSCTGTRFENACDREASPNIFVTFKDHQALPAYVMIYQPRG
eukprot:TRINITY_DN20078_c0_g1_i1.p1 TRINITY_DN20078_c0_g1~~TRINITY_DN20078_c0_g1_i1.p1  ORF type:complete len:401 (-),score=26.44 TRINITY_DN20078_c0_g1_i1:130-1332(-)